MALGPGRDLYRAMSAVARDLGFSIGGLIQLSSLGARLIIQKKVHRLRFRKSSAPVQRFGVHPVYTFYTQSEASVVPCSTNPTWRQNASQEI